MAITVAAASVLSVFCNYANRRKKISIREQKTWVIVYIKGRQATDDNKPV